MKYPEIRIKNAWLLKEEVSIHLHELWAKEGEELADYDDIDKIVAAYSKAWEPYEKRVLQGMCGLLDIEFKQNVIDVYIAPWFKGMSDPMVIGVTLKPDEFVDVLTHELLHRLLTDNTTKLSGTDYDHEWRKLFNEDHSYKTLVHIPVHAVHKAIYLDVLRDPERLKRDQAACVELKATDYVKSWEYIEENDYKKIIAKLKKYYRS